MNIKKTDAAKDPLGAMLLEYMHGNIEVSITVEAENFEMTTMTGATMFREYSEMEQLEQHALELCKGKTLDVGAGSGCHSLFLQQQGKEVHALDISPGCVQVLSERKIQHVMHQNLFSLKTCQYNTVLMLMNGIGICGTIDGLHLFFQFIPTLLAEGGQILVDSTDPFVLDGIPEEDYHPSEMYPGETDFIMKYKKISSEQFSWLYVDFETLRSIAELHGFQCERIITGSDGEYLAKIHSHSH